MENNKLSYYTMGILLLGGIIMYFMYDKTKEELKEQTDYNNSIRIIDSINNQRLLDEKDKMLFLYKDSLLKVEYSNLELKNKQNNKRYEKIKAAVLTADDSTKANYWSDYLNR